MSSIAATSFVRGVIAPLLPAARPLGQPRLWSMREIANGIFQFLRGRIAGRLLPKDLPPKSTVHGYFSAWRDSGLFASIAHHLVMLDRKRGGQEASPPLASPSGFACGASSPLRPGLVGAVHRHAAQQAGVDLVTR